MTQQPHWTKRHPSTTHFAPLFQYEHLPTDLQPVSRVFADAARPSYTTGSADPASKIGT